MGLLPSIVLGDVMPTHAAIVAPFAAPGKPRALVAPAASVAYILKCRWASSSVENADRLRATTDLGARGGGPDSSDS
jgi:hypothetical protein